MGFEIVWLAVLGAIEVAILAGTFYAKKIDQDFDISKLGITVITAFFVALVAGSFGIVPVENGELTLQFLGIVPTATMFVENVGKAILRKLFK